MQPPEPKPRHPISLFSARFAAVYLVLYAAPFPLGYFNFTAPLLAFFERAWAAAVAFFGAHLLRIAELHGSANSDSSLGLVSLALLSALSVVSALLWTRLDPRGRSQPRAEGVIATYLRYQLAAGVIYYAAIKVVRQQFPFPHLERLLVPFGNSRPIGLLWTFMGYSHAYSLFGGVLEMTGALLLCFAATAGAGALLLAGVMLNVVMINLCYNVNVKIYSAHLLLTALYLAAPYLRSVAVLLLTGQSSAVSRPLLPRGKVTNLVTAAGTLLMIYLAGSSLLGARDFVRSRGFERSKPRLYGIYQVDDFTKNGTALPPLRGDASRWATVIVDVANDHSYAFLVKSMSEVVTRYTFDDDVSEGVLVLSSQPPGEQVSLSWSALAPGRVQLSGTFAGSTISASLTRIDETALPLMKQPFSWIRD